MSVQEAPQYSPAQILDAGYRAEGEGRSEFALQFYRHLVDYYPNSPEAGVARESMARLSGPHDGSQIATWSGGLGQPPAANPASAPSAVPSLVLPGGPGGYSYGNGQGTDWPALATAGPVSRGNERPAVATGPRPPALVRASTPSVDASAHAVELPRSVRDYWSGRIAGRLLAWAGGALVMVGFGIFPLTILNPRLLERLPLLGAWLGGTNAALGVVAGGLCLLVLGQLVRAVLDQANATRDLAAIARTRASAELDRSGPNPAHPEAGGRGRKGHRAGS